MIFVFGSNKSGRHGAGAAAYAHKHYGALPDRTPVLVGSRALSYRLPTFKLKPEADWDIICDEKDEVKFKGLKAEFSRFEDLNNQALVDEYGGLPRHLLGERIRVLELEGQTIMKRSHLWRDRGFGKHITQYYNHLLPATFGSSLSVSSHPLCIERTKMTKKAYPQSNPQLNQSNEDFFDDAVDKKYDHDWLHELYAHKEQPMYTYMKRDDSQAWCERDMWDGFCYQDQVKCVAEECYVIATERFLVPSDWDYPKRLAYFKALEKVCTTLTSGWFRDFAIDNFPEVKQMYSEDKFNNVKGILDDTNT